MFEISNFELNLRKNAEKIIRGKMESQFFFQI